MPFLGIVPDFPYFNEVDFTLKQTSLCPSLSFSFFINRCTVQGVKDCIIDLIVDFSQFTVH